MRLGLSDAFSDRNELLEVLLGLLAVADRVDALLEPDPEAEPSTGPWLEVALGIVSTTRRLRLHMGRAQDSAPPNPHPEPAPPPRGIHL